ncbi:MAG: glycosyltransferase family 2 protein [Cellulomonadaceae bacterium]
MSAPLFSIVTPVYDPPVDVLREMIDSVSAQDFPDWELILVDDRSPSAEVLPVLRAAVQADPRVRVIERAENGGIVAASNDGLDAVRGEFVVLVDHDDLLTPDALSTVKATLDADPTIDYLYSDEDKLGPAGEFYDLFRKPVWSPERLRGQMYTCHLSVLRTALVRDVGGFHEGFDGSQDHDLVLRVTESARTVAHVPRVLYHWRVVPGSAAGDMDAKPYAWLAGQRAVQAHMDRLGYGCTVELGRVQGTYRLNRVLDPSLLISIVIPTRGSEAIVWGQRRCLVVEAVRSVLAHTRHQLFEVVVVHDQDTPAAVLQDLRAVAGDRLRLVPYGKPFNFSEKCNLGFLEASGDRIVLLNDDIEVRTSDFLEQLVAPLDEPDVGMTGARLLYADSRIQHAGHAYHGHNLTHPYATLPGDDVGYLAVNAVNREVSGLTAACVALRRDVYEEVGGMTELLPANFNDVDFSCKIRATGRRNVWLADVTAFHFESQTREPAVHKWEVDLIRSRWDLRGDDPYLPEFDADWRAEE